MSTLNVTMVGMICLCVAACSSPTASNATSGNENLVSDAGSDSSASSSAPVDRLFAAKFQEGMYDNFVEAAADSTLLKTSMHQCRLDMPAMGDFVSISDVDVTTPGGHLHAQLLLAMYDSGTPNVFRAAMYNLPPSTSEAISGVCDQPSKASAIDVAALKAAPPCQISVEWKNSEFTGGTVGDGCPAPTGANYDLDTLQITYTETYFEIWQRQLSSSGTVIQGTPTPLRLTRRTPAYRR